VDEGDQGEGQEPEAPLGGAVKGGNPWSLPLIFASSRRPPRRAPS